MKYQIITLAAKVYALYFPSAPVDMDSLDSNLQQIHLLYIYAMSLTRYDTSYDLRDRARLLKNAQQSPVREAALHTLKPVPQMETYGQRGAEWRLGSMAQVIAQDTWGGMQLPEWGSDVPENGVRDVPEVRSLSTPVVASGTAAAVGARGHSEREEKKKEKKVWKDLDKFYASKSETEEEEESEEESEEVEGEEEYEEGSEDESEDENEDEDEQQPLTGVWR